MQNVMKWEWLKRLSAFKSIQIKTVGKHTILWSKIIDEKPLNGKRPLCKVLTCTHMIHY